MTCKLEIHKGNKRSRSPSNNYSDPQASKYRCGVRYRGNQDTDGSREKVQSTYNWAAKVFCAKVMDGEINLNYFHLCRCDFKPNYKTDDIW